MDIHPKASNFPKSFNANWYLRDHKSSLVLFQKFFETNLDVEGSVLFSEKKLKDNEKWIRRSLFPTILSDNISKASSDYKVLKELFELN